MPLDELVGAPEVGDPRIRLKPRTRNGRVVFPLTQQSSGVQVWKVVIPPRKPRPTDARAGSAAPHDRAGLTARIARTDRGAEPVA